MNQASGLVVRGALAAATAALAGLAIGTTAGAAAGGSTLKITAVKRNAGESEFWIAAMYPATFQVYFDYGITKPHKSCPKNYNETDPIWHGVEGGTALPPGSATGRVAGWGLGKGKYRLCGYLADNNSAAANPPLARATKRFKVKHK